MRLIALDTETTGLDPSSGHKIVEIGAVEIIDLVPSGRKFHYYLNPERDMPLEAYKIHGLSSEFLQNKPIFREIADDFLNFIANDKLVIHNAQFDLRFLNYELKNIGKDTLPFDIAIDTVSIAKSKFPGSRVRLDDLCKRFRIDLSQRVLHGALLDAQLLCEVYAHLMDGYNSKQISFSISSANSSKEEINNNQIEELKEIKLAINQNIVRPTEAELISHQKLISFINKAKN